MGVDNAQQLAIEYASEVTDPTNPFKGSFEHWMSISSQGGDSIPRGTPIEDREIGLDDGQVEDKFPGSALEEAEAHARKRGIQV